MRRSRRRRDAVPAPADATPRARCTPRTLWDAPPPIAAVGMAVWPPRAAGTPRASPAQAPAQRHRRNRSDRAATLMTANATRTGQARSGSIRREAGSRLSGQGGNESESKFRIGFVEAPEGVWEQQTGRVAHLALEPVECQRRGCGRCRRQQQRGRRVCWRNRRIDSRLDESEGT